MSQIFVASAWIPTWFFQHVVIPFISSDSTSCISSLHLLLYVLFWSLFYKLFFHHLIDNVVINSHISTGYEPNKRVTLCIPDSLNLYVILCSVVIVYPSTVICLIDVNSIFFMMILPLCDMCNTLPIPCTSTLRLYIVSLLLCPLT